MFGKLILSALAAVAASTALAQEQQAAFTSTAVNVRAGPGQQYPVVTVLPRSYQLTIAGCLSDYTWCDVITPIARGWVYGGNLTYIYQDTYVPVVRYGPALGIAIAAFVLDDYWDRHYRDRPWYPQRQRWARRPPQQQPHFVPAPAPSGAAGPRPHPPAPISPRPHQPPGRSVVPRPPPQPAPQPPGAGP